jgi:4-diphosphocytidyl-2-C-methyl-D-erythritol kinase
LERELGVALPGVERLKLAAEIGSDVPLFLLGGAVLGLGRGELVTPMPDLPRTWCVVAVPSVGVSTPAAFKAWDALVAGEDAETKGEPMSQARDMGYSADSTSGAKAPIPEEGSGTAKAVPLTRRVAGVELPFLTQGVELPSLAQGVELTSLPQVDRLQELSLAYSSLSAPTGVSPGGTRGDCEPGTSGIVRDPNPEKKRDLPDESQADAMNDLAENTLLALVRTGIGNDFEEVVFPQYPSLRITKRQLMGSDSDSSDVSRPAIYAALSGSGSALFGLYRSEADAKAAQQRVQSSGVQALLTETLPRAEYWERMFAE